MGKGGVKKVVRRERGMQFRVLQYNIDAANREQQVKLPENERVSRLFFQNRVPGIIETIVSSGAAIATIQELRDLGSSPIDSNEFIYLVKKATKLEVVGPFFYEKDVFSFALATFYNRALLCVKNTGLIPLPGDKICLWVLFECIASGRLIIIANTHFVVSPENVKTESISVLFDSLACLRIQYGDCPLIVNGDYNLFDDMDGNAQRTFILNHYGCSDVYYPLYMNQEDTVPLSGTFIGYPETDPHHKTPETMSRLDHGFLMQSTRQSIEVVGNAFTVGVTYENLTNAALPSDHLPCVVEIRLPL